MKFYHGDLKYLVVVVVVAAEFAAMIPGGEKDSDRKHL